MLATVQYIREHGLEALTTDLGIKIREYDDLLVLNYDQIESPKTHPVVIECRGLILEKDTYRVVSRKLDRFFNLGEAPETMAHLDINKARAYDKVDGSLIGIYNYCGAWYAATRGTAMAEANCAWGDTFFSLVLKAMDCDEEGFQLICDYHLEPYCTYVFEITCPENRVVTRYEGYKLHYLACRVNETGEYIDGEEEALAMGAVKIGEHSFDSIEHCVETAHALPDLKEGYVVYQDGKPVCKIKSPAYVAAHHIRGNGITPKSAMELVLLDEQDEYLAYFPEDADFFAPYEESFKAMLHKIDDAYDDTKHIESQKDFALAVKRYPFSDVLFKARARGENPIHTFHQKDLRGKMKILQSWMGI